MVDSGKSLRQHPSGESKIFEKTLTDVEREIYIEKWCISSDELEVGKGWRIEKCRLHGGLSDGVDIVTIDNGRLSFTVVPTRGMGIWKGCCQEAFLGWDSPIKNLVHPHYVNIEARGGLGWLDGFNEWIVRCGLGNFGVPGTDVIIDNMGGKKSVMLTLHGKIANTPAKVVKAKVGLEPPFEMGVEGVVYERSMYGANLKLTTSITTTLGSNSLKISDLIENLRSIPDEMQILYHCNYGGPFLEEGSRFIAPISRVAPRDSIATKGIDGFDIYGPPESGFIEQVYFMELIGGDDGLTKVMLVNKDETKAVSISYPLNELPHFTLWKDTGALEDGYVTGLEPGTSFPNPKSFEREKGRVLKLKPREKYRSEVILSVQIGKEEVRRVKDEIEGIKKRVKPKIFKEPVSNFSPS